MTDTASGETPRNPHDPAPTAEGQAAADLNGHTLMATLVGWACVNCGKPFMSRSQLAAAPCEIDVHGGGLIRAVDAPRFGEGGIREADPWEAWEVDVRSSIIAAHPEDDDAWRDYVTDTMCDVRVFTERLIARAAAGGAGVAHQPAPADDLTWMRPVFEAMAFDWTDDLWWRCDDGRITWFVLCSDTFAYATGDCEEIKPEDAADLAAAIEEAKALDTVNASVWAATLWVARKRRRLPITPIMEKFEPELRALFEAAAGGSVGTPGDTEGKR